MTILTVFLIRQRLSPLRNSWRMKWRYLRQILCLLSNQTRRTHLIIRIRRLGAPQSRQRLRLRSRIKSGGRELPLRAPSTNKRWVRRRNFQISPQMQLKNYLPKNLTYRMMNFSLMRAKLRKCHQSSHWKSQLTREAQTLPARPPIAQRCQLTAREATEMACRSWTCEYSKLNPVSKKTATTRRNASSIMIKTGGGPLAPILRKCAATLRQASVLKAMPAPRRTTELSPSTTQRSTKQSSATSGPTTSIRATSATYVPSLTSKKSCRLTFFIKWSRTMTSTCSTSRLSGAPSTTRWGVICVMNVSTPTTGKTSAASRTSTSIRLGSSVTFGPPRKKQGSIPMVAT